MADAGIQDNGTSRQQDYAVRIYDTSFVYRSEMHRLRSHDVRLTRLINYVADGWISEPGPLPASPGMPLRGSRG